MFAISRRMGAESRNPEDVYSAMLIQGVSTRDCPGNLISPRPQLSATGLYDVTQPICHFERSAATMLAISGRMGAESRNPEMCIPLC